MTALPPQKMDLNQIKVSNPHNVHPVYTNNAVCFTSANDARIVLHELVLDSPADDPRLELRANVVMALPQLKALHQAIGETIANYEKQFGTVQWPPQQPKTK